MDAFASAALTIAMLAAFLLALGGLKLARNADTRKRGVLMLVAALVLIANVAILSV